MIWLKASDVGRDLPLEKIYGDAAFSLVGDRATGEEHLEFGRQQFEVLLSTALRKTQ